jgi:glycine/D-amino acid oxidase-like deaminating enzyme/nitrite reductase/ring-hydroxylating ferredoxin subunit
MNRHPAWRGGAQPLSFPPLEADLHVDVCVVGAGIAGLSVAYQLACAGRSVAVLDDGPVGGGMTQASTGHLVSMLDDRYYELEALRGRDAARLAAASHAAAIDCVEEIVKREGIECGFARLDGYLFLAEDDKAETLDRELEAARRAGLGAVMKHDCAPFTSFNCGPCLVFPRQGRLDPLAYVHGLARALERRGGRIFCGSHVGHIEGGTPALAWCGERFVSADAVVVATNVPVNDLLAIHTKQAPYQTYVIAARVPRGAVPDILSWDTGDPYHYIRMHGDLLIVGGEDHKSGQEESAGLHARLEQWARARFPMMGAVEFAWGGQVMEPLDYLGYIGRNPGDHDNVYVATGDSGMGLTHGTIAGLLIRDLIAGGDNPWQALYEPSRKLAGTALDFAAENLNVARQYAQWLTPGEVDAPGKVPPGEGAIVRRGLQKIAVYRDPQGALHERSAACPHLGCIVQWNSAGKTWDCPCHGSKFNATGKVLNGPANIDLAPAETKDQRAA